MFPIRRVLVIDDDGMMRDLLAALLPMEGYEVTTFAEGEEAVRTLCRNHDAFDCVLTDLNLPGLEGSALTEALRSAVPGPMPLIGMSGTQPAPAVRCGLDAFLLKPFDLASLQQSLQQAQTTVSRAAEQQEESSSSSSSRMAALKPEETGLEPLDNTIFTSLCRIIPLGQLVQLYELTLTDITKRLERIRHAATAGDLASAQREAHAIKGSCGMVGAAELQSLAAAIEGGTSVNTSAIAQIPSACLRLRRMLDTKLQPA